MKLKLLISTIICLLICHIQANGQYTSQPQYFVQQLAPRSPNATAIEKYGTYQVNEFTGIPDISIPLYTIEAGGLQVPVTLSYHASGIKVTDVASWVGLGWSVSSGGQVSRRTFGLQDDSPFGYLRGHLRPSGSYNSSTADGLLYQDSVATSLCDARPDLYSYDFPGHGGKFFFDGSPGGNFVPRLIPFAPIKITHTMSAYSPPNNPATTGITRFNITDEHGNTYAFGDPGGTEVTYATSGGRPSESWYAAAWKIENMISQNRRDTVSFTYQQDLVYYPAADNEIYTVIDNVVNILAPEYSASYSQAPTYTGNITATTEMLPRQINFKNGMVVFDLDDTTRTDLPGTDSHAYGLADIKVYQYNFGTKAMELQKTIVFYKSYFSPSVNSRLRLDSIQVLDKAGSIMQHYRFDYNTSISLPAYTAYSQDYWGYYNGATGNTMLTPAQSIIYNPGTPETVTIGQANRNCDSTNMQAYVLTGIHYPTGGYSTFTYQTNQYYKAGVFTLAGGLRIHTISSYDGVNPAPIVKTYVYDINNALPNFLLDYDYFSTMQIHRNYQADQGALTVYATADFRSFSSSPHCDLEGYDAATVMYPQVTEYIGTPGTNVGRTDYTFTDASDAVSDASQAGSLVYLSSFFARGQLLTKKEFISLGSGVYQPVMLTTNTYSAFGEPVQYNNVGLTVYKRFYNEGASNITNPILPGNAEPDDTNSYNPLYYAIISADNYLTSTVINVYDTNDTTKKTTSTVNYYYDNITHQQITRTYHVDSKGNTHVSVNRYPADYTSGYTIIDSMVNRNMQAEVIEKYDTLKNAATGVNAIVSGQLNQYKEGLGGGYTVVPAKISTLSVTQPIANFTPSAVASGSFTSDSRYVQMISFDQYDPYNNILQYTPRNSTPVAVFWDYQNDLPVAQVKNAVNSTVTVAYTSFEADGKGNWLFTGAPVNDPTAPAGTMVYPLTAGSINSYTLSGSAPYVLSYWSNNGPATVYAGSYLTGTPLNSRNGWTYYEYQVPAGTYVLISGTTSIDELRLYPAAAQMSTYAYDPSGVRTMADTKGSANYFEYDFFQRLKNVKDWNGNIVKNYGYHNYDQTVPNAAMTGTFTRNNCPAGTNPGSAPFSVPAAKYYSSTLASANAEASYDLNTNGQANANATCGCPVAYVSVAVTNNTPATFTTYFSGISSPYNIPVGSSTMSVPEGTYATYTINANDSNTHSYTLGVRPPQNGVHNASFSTVVIQPGSTDLTLTIN